MRVYVDSCLQIYGVEQVEPWVGPVHRLLARSDLTIVTSSLVLMECLVLPLRNGNSALAAQYGRWLARFEARELSRAVFALAAQLRADAPALRTPDAIHLACAIHYGCEEFWTNDDRGLSRAAAGRLAVRTITD